MNINKEEELNSNDLDANDSFDREIGAFLAINSVVYQGIEDIDLDYELRDEYFSSLGDMLDKTKVGYQKILKLVKNVEWMTSNWYELSNIISCKGKIRRVKKVMNYIKEKLDVEI